MLSLGIQKHMAAQIVDLLPRLGDRVGVEAAQCAALYQAQAPRGGEPKDADAFAAVRWGHDDGNSLIKHGLVTAVCVDVNGG